MPCTYWQGFGREAGYDMRRNGGRMLPIDLLRYLDQSTFCAFVVRVFFFGQRRPEILLRVFQVKNKVGIFYCSRPANVVVSTSYINRSSCRNVLRNHPCWRESPESVVGRPPFYPRMTLHCPSLSWSNNTYLLWMLHWIPHPSRITPAPLGNITHL